ncbi:MAG: DUF4231 domain-containing protein [Cyanobacteria bacterium P01_C01_bin.120]
MPTPLPDSEISSVATINDPSSLALLRDVWERHRIYSKNASNAQERFFWVRRILAYLSVAIVVLAVAQPSIEYNSLDSFVLAVVNFLLILLPIVVTAMLAFAVKFDRGNSWVLLRGNSEALKMEIYLYRSRVKEYRQNRNAVLATKVQQISERVKSSSVHEAAFNPYEWEPETRTQRGWIFKIAHYLLDAMRRGAIKVWDFLFHLETVSGTSLSSASDSQQLLDLPRDEYEYQKIYADLDAEKYLYFRLEKQFDWYRHKCKQYDRQNQVLQTSVYFFAGLGTLFAAVEEQYLIPISAAVSTTLVNYLEYRRVEATLVGYNQAADTLYDIHVWWHSLSAAAKQHPANFEKLVTKTEETIRAEHGSWLQDMQERLSSLYGDDDNHQVADSQADDIPETGIVKHPMDVEPHAEKDT